jgi:acyl carrier protein
MYGITETTVHVTSRPLRLADLDEPIESPLGRPIPGWQLYLLDHYQHLVPMGVPGEIHVGGAGVTPGYLNRPELTAARFIPNPFSPFSGDALYRSGDLACYLPNGDLEYLGRIDQQVKLRGFRIELSEIEAVLHQQAGVQACVVVAHQVAANDKRLIAYVVPKTDSVSSPELRQFLKTRLPDYMLPATFVFLEALPLTSNGTLDRRALPLPEGTNPSSTLYQAPRTVIEKNLAEIWADVLRVDQVGIQDNFFELGGHSLIATQLIARVRRAFNMELSLRVLFETRTIEGMAQAIQEQERGIDQPPLGVHAASHQPERLLARLDQLSDEEVENLLSEIFQEASE